MKIFNDLKNIDISIIKVMKCGFKIAGILALVASYILFLYIQNPISHVTFEVGYLIAKGAVMFFVCFFVGAFASDKIKKSMIWTLW